MLVVWTRSHIQDSSGLRIDLAGEHVGREAHLIHICLLIGSPMSVYTYIYIYVYTRRVVSLVDVENIYVHHCV